MKRFLAAILCISVVFAMTFTAFGAENGRGTGYCGDEGCPEISLSDLGDALSGLLSDLSDAIPEIVASVEEALPGAVSGIKDAIDERAESEKAALDSLLEMLGITEDSSSDPDAAGVIDESTRESLQQLADQVSGVLGGFAAAGGEDVIIDDLANDPGAADDGQDMIVGGWTVNTEYTSQLSKEEEEIFAKAESTLAGGAYKPVAVLATQLVAGTNYAYLCLGAPEEEGQKAGWYIVALYQDLKGNVTTMSIKSLDLGDLKSMGNFYNPSFTGSWTAKVPEEEAGAPVLPDAAQAAFEAALKGYVGVGYTPIALLGTQVVAGVNYKILCYGTLVTREPVTSWYVLDIYQDPQGECSITDVQLFDLTAYISYGEE